MILGIGTDLIEVNRVRQKVAKEDFSKRVFSEREIALCRSKGRPAESFAARFAAKEAFLKALGTGWDGTTSFAEIEVLSTPSGQPFIELTGRTKDRCAAFAITNIHVSLSHLNSIASAIVVIESS